MIKKILLTVFIAVTATVTALALYYVSAPVNTEELMYETVKHSVIAENAYITPALTETEISMLAKKIGEHGKLLSKIPLFE